MSDSGLSKILAEELSQSAQIKKQLGPFAFAIMVNCQQGQFAVPSEDMQVGLHLRTRGSYGKAQLERLAHLLDKTSRVLVVGAHIGALAIPLARSCHSVTAIEPNPDTFELLKLNILLNNVTNCKAICIAASDRFEKIEFLQSAVNTGGSKRKPIVRWHYFFDDPQLTEVEAAPLDDLLQGQEFDLILMDIEGSEYFALQGMQRILSRAQVLEVEFLAHHLKFVAGISAEQLASKILPYFSWMQLSTGELLERAEIEGKLTEMFAKEQDDEGILFLKNKPPL